MQFRLSAYLNICGVNPKEHSVKQELVNPFLTLNYLNFIIPFNGSFVLDIEQTLSLLLSHMYHLFHLQDRIRSYMDRAKNIQDAAKAPKIDKAASKRFVKSALWKAAKKKTSEADSSGEATPNSTGAEGTVYFPFLQQIYW